MSTRQPARCTPWHHRAHAAAASLALGLMLWLPVAASAASACSQEASPCSASASVVATVTQFRAGNRGPTHWAQANLRFVNRGRDPVTLAYVERSGHLLDEHGNRYEVKPGTGVHGIGVAARREVDTSFTLQPGEGAEARFEYGWYRYGQERTGLQFQMALAVREVAALPGGQVRLGREHTLRWDGLRDAAAMAAGPASATPMPEIVETAASPDAAARAGDACGGRANCRNFGAFAAEAVRLSKSRQGAYDHVRVDFRIVNHGGAPVILGLQGDGAGLIDDRGERWVLDSQRPGRVTGIGVVYRGRADPQLRLAPGQTGHASVEFVRYGKDNGSRAFSADLGLVQLEVLPGDQVRTVREHALSFPQLRVGTIAAPGAGATDAAAGVAELVNAVQSLKGLFGK
jgi:hypothetical protein